MTPHDHEQPYHTAVPPILDDKHYDQPTVFTAENLLREARRQKGIGLGRVPAVCVLDPDGDLEEYLHGSGQAQSDPTWACYHTQLSTFVHLESGSLRPAHHLALGITPHGARLPVRRA